MADKTKPRRNSLRSTKARAIAREIQGDIPLTVRPFDAIGKRLQLTETEVIKTVRDLLADKTIRKFGAIVRHRNVGYVNNIMVLWSVPDGSVEETGRKLAAFSEVTHCYERTPRFADRYNLFTMIHLKDRNDDVLLQRMAEVCGISDFKVLRTLEEFKKQSMEYF